MAFPAALFSNLSRPQAPRFAVFTYLAFFALPALWLFSMTDVVSDSAGFLSGSSHRLGTPDGQRVAVIIESNSQSAPNLVPVMLHFANVLGPTWSVVLFTLEQHWEVPASAAFARAMSGGQISVRFLPPDTQLTNSRSVSGFLARPWLWQQLRTAHRVLMFQLDSILCSGSPAAVDDFFEYDFGAPIDARYGVGYNGGLSLRNPKLFLSIATEVDFQQSGVYVEDQWFFAEAQKRAEMGEARLPSPEVAREFAVEMIYHDRPLGYHQPERWQKDNMGKIRAWCPEVGMLIGRRAT